MSSLEVGKHELEEEAAPEKPETLPPERLKENLTKSLSEGGNAEDPAEFFDEAPEGGEDAPQDEGDPAPPPVPEVSGEPANDYRSLRRKSGAPAFNEAELRILEADPRTLKPKQKEFRQKLQDRAAKYRATLRERKDRVESKREGEELEAQRREEALERLKGATGKEAYEIFNGGIELAESLSSVLPPDLAVIDRLFVETFRYSDKFMEEQAVLTKQCMLRNPRFSKWLLLDGAPELRLGVVLYLDAKEKARIYRERKAAATQRDA